MMKSKVTDHLQRVMILFKLLTTKSVKDSSSSQFQNFRVNLHKFHALFSMRL
jgi:hypothetical protein